MEREGKYFLVGVFVVLSLVAITAAILWLSDIKGSNNIKLYSVYFRNHSLEGLQKDSVVTMKGIKVGSVKDYHISTSNIEEVKVILELEQETPIKIDTEVVVKRNILTGLSWIELIGGTEKSNFLTELREGERYPVIPEGKGVLDELADNLPEVLNQFRNVSERINTLISDDNIKSIEGILSDLKATTAIIAKNKNSIDRTLSSLDKLSTNIEASSREFSKFSTVIGGDLSKVLNSVESLTSETKSEVSKISSSFRRSSKILNKEITSISQSISEAARNVGRTAEGLERPKNIILGPNENELGPGESIK